jgi:hypothetical protein
MARWSRAAIAGRPRRPGGADPSAQVKVIRGQHRVRRAMRARSVEAKRCEPAGGGRRSEEPSLGAAAAGATQLRPWGDAACSLAGPPACPARQRFIDMAFRTMSLVQGRPVLPLATRGRVPSRRGLHRPLRAGGGAMESGSATLSHLLEAQSRWGGRGMSQLCHNARRRPAESETHQELPLLRRRMQLRRDMHRARDGGGDAGDASPWCGTRLAGGCCARRSA